ncbi:SUN domain-containing protein 1-like [Diretmus argenteus]
MSVSDGEVDLDSWGWTDLWVSALNLSVVSFLFFCMVSVVLSWVSSSYSSPALDFEPERQVVPVLRIPPVMSRRSLRIPNTESLLDHTLPYGSASFSVGGTGRKGARKSRLSVSCSQSLLHTPRPQADQSIHNSSLHSVAMSDATLLSSMLDESSIQERTLVDSFWGLDQDVDPKESTVLAEHAAVQSNSNGDAGVPSHPAAQTQTSMVKPYYCNDYRPHSEQTEALSAYYPSSKYTSSSTKVAGDPGCSTIYCRDKIHKSKKGLLASVWHAGIGMSRRSAASVVYLFTLLYHHMLLKKPHDVTGDLRSVLDSILLCGSRTAASVGSALTWTFEASQTLITQVTRSTGGKTEEHTGNGKVLNGARSSCSGTASMKESGSDENPLGPSGSLCKAAGGVSCRLGTIWHHVVDFMSLFCGFFLTRCLPNLLRLLLVLVPLLILLGLCWWSPAGLLSVLPAVNVTEWRSVLPSLSSIYTFTFTQSRSADDPAALPYRPLPAETPRGAEEEAVDSLRLLQLEQSMAGLWERVEAGRRQTEQRHREVLQMYQDLQQQLFASRSLDDGGAEPWAAGLLDHRLDELRGRLDEEKLQREQYLEQQQNQASHLAELERLLEDLASNTQEMQQRQEAATAEPSPTTQPAAVSVGVDQESHNALLEEVARLEEALGSVRRDLQGLTGCQDRCGGLDNIQETVSVQVLTQVREELRTLLYGNQQTPDAEASGDPDSLLPWLSQRFVSGDELQAALASLELSVLEQLSREHAAQVDTLRHTEAPHAAGAAGDAVTEEDVRLIVRNALRLYAQDRTGLADYALESGGGSILSTRCSETYETKTALMSLFGLPLWFYSQSPRTVIQPDVQPGNCWAFRGSKGYLVIRLSMKILPTAFSLEHIPKALAPSGMLRSAPRDFAVYGLEDERQQDGKLLGRYRYEQDGEALQTYPVSEENDDAYQIVEVRVSSNWGHQDYTCMYRFRVHGKPGGH